jgi:hypothetical protein
MTTPSRNRMIAKLAIVLTDVIEMRRIRHDSPAEAVLLRMASELYALIF